MGTAHNPQFGRQQNLLIYAVLAVLVAVLAVAALGRLHVAETRPSLADSRATVQLRFVDRSDGGVDVISASNGERVSEFAPTTNGFARSVVRSFTRERRRSGIGPETPFTLLLRADGGISLHDPATGRQVSLDAFGIDNLRVFADLLKAANPQLSSART